MTDCLGPYIYLNFQFLVVWNILGEIAAAFPAIDIVERRQAVRRCFFRIPLNAKGRPKTPLLAG